MSTTNGSDASAGFDQPDPFVSKLSFNAEKRLVDEVVRNFYETRSNFFNRLIGSNERELNEMLGYPVTEELSPDTYREMFDREPIAKRVVEVFPKESWQEQPNIYEDEDPETDTPFEEAFADMCQNLRGKSWFKDQEGNPLFSIMERADILSGVGQFGILLLGFSDGQPMNVPVASVMDQYNWVAEKGMQAAEFLGIFGTDAQYTGVEFNPPMANPSGPVNPNGIPQQPSGAQSAQPQVDKSIWMGNKPNNPNNSSKKQSTSYSKANKLLFLRPYDESLVQVVQYESNQHHPRFGQPVMYRVTLSDYRMRHSGVGLPNATVMVHWTRVIHLADSLLVSDIFGVPRQQPVYNRLLSLNKLYGGSAEMFWRGAFPGLSFETQPQMGGDAEIDQKALSATVQAYAKSLDRWMATKGMNVRSLAPQVADPSGFIEVQLVAICIVLGIPMRIFMGSERGELASGQDDGTWNDRLMHRQQNYITPYIIVPFIDRMIQAKVLPEPTDGYSISWPDLKEVGPVEKASIASARMSAAAAYISSDIQSMIPVQMFLTKELDYTDEEAKEAEEECMKQLQAMNPDVEDGQLQHGYPAPEAEEPEVNPDTGLPFDNDQERSDYKDQASQQKEAEIQSIKQKPPVGNQLRGIRNSRNGGYKLSHLVKADEPWLGVKPTENTHDVSGEPRDDHGRWTTGGSAGGPIGGQPWPKMGHEEPIPKMYQKYPHLKEKADATRARAESDLARQHSWEQFTSGRYSKQPDAESAKQTRKDKYYEYGSKLAYYSTPYIKHLADTVGAVADRKEKELRTGPGKREQNKINKERELASKRVTAWGIEGNAKRPFRKEFKSIDSLQRWADNNKAEIHGMLGGQPTEDTSASPKAQQAVGKVSSKAMDIAKELGGFVAKDLAWWAVKKATHIFNGNNDPILTANSAEGAFVTNEAVELAINDLADSLLWCMESYLPEKQWQSIVANYNEPQVAHQELDSNWPVDNSGDYDPKVIPPVGNTLLTLEELDYPYGSCPTCVAPGVTRERRKGGNDKCVSGHVYPSDASIQHSASYDPDNQTHNFNPNHDPDNGQFTDGSEAGVGRVFNPTQFPTVAQPYVDPIAEAPHTSTKPVYPTKTIVDHGEVEPSHVITDVLGAGIGLGGTLIGGAIGGRAGGKLGSFLGRTASISGGLGNLSFKVAGGPVGAKVGQVVGSLAGSGLGGTAAAVGAYKGTKATLGDSAAKASVAGSIAAKALGWLNWAHHNGLSFNQALVSNTLEAQGMYENAEHEYGKLDEALSYLGNSGGDLVPNQASLKQVLKEIQANVPKSSES